MKKQLSAFFIALCWVVGMMAVFSFPPKIDQQQANASGQTVLNELSIPDLHLRTSSGESKTPPFEIDWRLSTKLNSEWIPDFLTTEIAHISPSFFQKSRSLLDILQFFIQYFYSW